MIARTELQTTLVDQEKAFTEVSFILEVLTETINQVIGQSVSSLGISAGKHMAKKMPIYLTDPTLEETLSALAQKLQSGFDISCARTAQGADIQITRCAIRDVCANRKLDIGGQLCTMFHYYLAGMCAELMNKPVRAGTAIPNSKSCTFPLEAK